MGISGHRSNEYTPRGDDPRQILWRLKLSLVQPGRKSSVDQLRKATHHPHERETLRRYAALSASRLGAALHKPRVLNSSTPMLITGSVLIDSAELRDASPAPHPPATTIHSVRCGHYGASGISPEASWNAVGLYRIEALAAALRSSSASYQSLNPRAVSAFDGSSPTQNPILAISV